MATTCKLIAKNVLGSDTATVTFSSIPGTGYTDLAVLVSARSARASALADTLLIGFNGATTNLTFRALYGSGSIAGSFSGSTGGAFDLPAANATASTFGSGLVYIPNYAGSTNKSFSWEGAQESNGTESYITVGAGLWSQTTAISSIELSTTNTQNFKSGSSFFLYGITKA